MRPIDLSIRLRQKQRKLLWRERVINQIGAQEIQAKVNMIDAESRRQQRNMDYHKKLLEYEMGDQRSSGIYLQSESLSSASSVSSSSSETSIPPPDDRCCKIHGLSAHCRFYPCEDISDYHSIRDISNAFLVRLGTDCFVEDEKPHPLTRAQIRERGLRYMTGEMRKQQYSKLVTREWSTNYGNPVGVNINKVAYTSPGHQ